MKNLIINSVKCIALVFPLHLFGCTFNFEVTSQKTALENQILGTYQEIDDELILMSTLRGTDDRKLDGTSNFDSRLQYHRMNQMFNRDDIDELQSARIIGETSSGELELLPEIIRGKCSPRALSLAKALLEEENNDRVTILEFVLKKKGDASIDLYAMKKAYGSIQIKKLDNGFWFKNNVGKWQIKN